MFMHSLYSFISGDISKSHPEVATTSRTIPHQLFVGSSHAICVSEDGLYMANLRHLAKKISW